MKAPGGRPYNFYVDTDAKELLRKGGKRVNEIDIRNLTRDYGNGKGVFDRNVCAAYGLKLKRECASQSACEGCGTSPSVCPTGENGTGTISEADCNTLATANQQHRSDLSCFTLQHRPSGGMSVLIESMIGEIN